MEKKGVRKHDLVRLKRYGRYCKLTIHPELAAAMDLSPEDQVLVFADPETKTGWFQKITDADVELLADVKKISEAPWRKAREIALKMEPVLPLSA